MSSFTPRFRARLNQEAGFSLIELLIVLVVMAVLLTIAVPSYLGFEARAHRTAAQANLRSALPVIEAYRVDHDTYAGMNVDALRTIDASIAIEVVSAEASTYCIRSSEGSSTYYKSGPGGSVARTVCV